MTICEIAKLEHKFTETKDPKKLEWFMDYLFITRDLEIAFKAYKSCEKPVIGFKERMELLIDEMKFECKKEFEECRPFIEFFKELNTKRNIVAHSYRMFELDENGYKKIEAIKKMVHGLMVEMPLIVEDGSSKIDFYTGEEDF